MVGMFDGCFSLTSIDLSSFDTKNVIYFGLIFDNCPNLRYIDISSFNCNSEYFYDIFTEFPDFGTIKVNNNCVSIVEEYISSNWSIISE